MAIQVTYGVSAAAEMDFLTFSRIPVHWKLPFSTGLKVRFGFDFWDQSTFRISLTVEIERGWAVPPPEMLSDLVLFWYRLNWILSEVDFVDLTQFLDSWKGWWVRHEK